MATFNDAPHMYLQFGGQGAYRRYVQKGSPPLENNAPDAPSHGSYGALLLRPEWKAKRREILDRDGHRCVHCRSINDLQVHHRQYHFVVSQQKFRLPWEYPEHLLITLCESCHNKGHNKYKVPTVKIQ